MAFPENPAAINASHNDAFNLAWKYKIEGQKSKAAQVDEQMQGLLQARRPGVGDRALYGAEGSTIADKVNANILRV